MDPVRGYELVGRVAAACSNPEASRERLRAGLADVATLSGMLAAAKVRLARRLAEQSSFPEGEIAQATRSSHKSGAATVERAGLLADAPLFEESLGDGKIQAGHVDALGRGLKELEPAQRPALLARAPFLLGVAERATPEQFARTVREEARRVAIDDGMAKLERQCRAVRLRSWVDPVTGMWHINGQFDPVTGLQLNGRLDAAIAALFADKTPETCPSVPGEKQDHLRGLALLNLVGIDPDATEEKAYSPRPAGPRFGRPEFVIVVDTANCSATGAPMVDCGLPVDIPWRVLVELFGAADVHTVVVRNGVVLCAPGRLDLGRTTRIASRAQRRALRGVYATCAVPGCSVRYDHTKLHHVRFWEHGGATDLDNLLPLCERHHHCVHDLGWQVRLGPQRELTITLPDGTIMTTGPPHRDAA